MVLTCDRHRNMSGLNSLMESQPTPFISRFHKYENKKTAQLEKAISQK